MNPMEFLMTIWPRRRGYVFLGAKTPGGWVEVRLPPSGRERRLRDFLDEHLERHDVYFCPNAFSEPRRLRELALPTRWLHCDIDAGDVDAFEPRPSILWQTSPGRTQALWRLDKRVSVQDAEDFNHAFAQLGDAGGWSITKFLRISGSINFKPHYKRPRVKLLHADWTPITDRPGKMPDRPSRRGLAQGDDAPRVGNVDPYQHDPEDVYKRFGIGKLYRGAAGNRSAALWAIGNKMLGKGATPDEIACALWHCRSGDKYREDRTDAQALDALQAEIERLVRKNR